MRPEGRGRKRIISPAWWQLAGSLSSRFIWGNRWTWSLVLPFIVRQGSRAAGKSILNVFKTLCLTRELGWWGSWWPVDLLRRFRRVRYGGRGEIALNSPQPRLSTRLSRHVWEREQAKSELSEAGRVDLVGKCETFLITCDASQKRSSIGWCFVEQRQSVYNTSFRR